MHAVGRPAVFSAVTVAIGLAVTLGDSYLAHLAFVRDFPEQADDQRLVWLGGGLFLFLPYVLLAVLGRRARPGFAYVALALLVGLSIVFRTAAASDAQGALIVFYTWPLQILVAVGTTWRRLRRSVAATIGGASH